MIRDTIQNFIRRVTDRVFEGRNRTRIVLGTDRNSGIDSGYGDGGKNDIDSGAIDMVAGYAGENPDFSLDSSRVYISGKADIDQYLNIDKGPDAAGEPAACMISDHIRLKGRSTIKVVVGDNVLLIDNGSITIEAGDLVELKVGDSRLRIRSGTVELDTGGGTSRRVITEDDIAGGIVTGPPSSPALGSTVSVGFKPSIGNGGQSGIINNQNVKIK